MAFIRRGCVKRPHREDALICLTRVGMHPITVYLKDISCWEEHQLNPKLTIVIMYFITGSNFSVIETFEAIDELANGKAVAS